MEGTPSGADELVVAVRERFGLSLDDVADALGCSPSTVRRIHAGATAGERYLEALQELHERGTIRKNRLVGRRGGEEPEGFSRQVHFASNGDRLYFFVLEKRSGEAKAALCAQVLLDLQRVTRNERSRGKQVFFGVGTPTGRQLSVSSRVGNVPAEVISMIQEDCKGSVLAYLSDRLSRSNRYAHQHTGAIASINMSILDPRVGRGRALDESREQGPRGLAPIVNGR